MWRRFPIDLRDQFCDTSWSLFSSESTCTVGRPVTNFLESITFRTIWMTDHKFLGSLLPSVLLDDRSQILGTLSPSVLLNGRSQIPWDYHFLYSSRLPKKTRTRSFISLTSLTRLDLEILVLRAPAAHGLSNVSKKVGNFPGYSIITRENRVFRNVART